MKHKKLYAIFLCTLVTTIFSFHYIVAKLILTAGVSQYSLSAWRGLLGGGILLIIYHKKISLKIIKENVFVLFMVAFLGFFINQILFMKGLSLTTPLYVAIISNTIPIITAIFAFVVGLERPNMKKIIGILITFSFVSYLIIEKQNGHTADGFFNLGNTLILLNVIAFSLAFIFGKKLLKKDFPYELLTGIMLFGGGIMMSLVAQERMSDIITYATANTLNFSYIIFEILISTSIVYLLNLKALQLMDITKVSFFIYLQPIITGIGDFIINGHKPGPELYFVFIGILIGAYLVVMQKSD